MVKSGNFIVPHSFVDSHFEIIPCTTLHHATWSDCRIREEENMLMNNMGNICGYRGQRGLPRGSTKQRSNGSKCPRRHLCTIEMANLTRDFSKLHKTHAAQHCNLQTNRQANALRLSIMGNTIKLANWPKFWMWFREREKIV